MRKTKVKIELDEYLRLVDFEKEIAKGNMIVAQGFSQRIYTRDEAVLELSKSIVDLQEKLDKSRREKFEFMKNTSVAKFIKLKFNL